MRRTSLSLVAFLVVGLSLGGAIGCTSAAQRRVIVSLNEVQEAAASTYDTAKVVEGDATARCRAALDAARKPPPVTADEVKGVCAAVGVVLPYDPVGLQKAAGPINALYDGIRAANAQRMKTGALVPAETMTDLAGLLEQVIADLVDAGVPVPDKVKAMPATMRGP
jgi:hypothetical protein